MDDNYVAVPVTFGIVAGTAGTVTVTVLFMDSAPLVTVCRMVCVPACQ